MIFYSQFSFAPLVSLMHNLGKMCGFFCVFFVEIYTSNWHSCFKPHLNKEHFERDIAVDRRCKTS